MEHKIKPGTSKTRLSSVANSIELLKVFSDEEYELGISSLAKRLGLAKSTVHRLATTLVRADMLEQDRESGKYRLGLALFELGSMVRRNMDVVAEAKPYLKLVMEKTGETVHLGILDHSSVLYINKIETRQAIRMNSNIGGRAPVHCTALGKAILAFQDAETIDAVIAHGLAALTPKTITDPDLLKQELATVRARNYAIDDEEIEIGLRGVAAPIRSHTGDVFAALSIAGPVQRMTKKVVASYVPDVMAAAEAVSQRLGYLPHRLPYVRQRI